MFDRSWADLALVTSDVLRKASTASGRVENGLREHNAALLGLTPIGRVSAFALVVGVHPQLPDVVFKVCPKNDGFIAYATDCLNCALVGPHFLKVYSVTKIDDYHTLCVVERLVSEPDNEDLEAVDAAIWRFSAHRASSGLVQAVKQLAERYGHLDLHSGNYMKRADGTIVFCDPVAGDL